MAFLSFSSSEKRFFCKISRFYRISPSQITHCKTRVKTSGPNLAGDPRFFSEILGKKHFPPPSKHGTQAGRVGWVRGCEGVRAGWLVGWLAGWLVGWFGR